MLPVFVQIYYIKGFFKDLVSKKTRKYSFFRRREEESIIKNCLLCHKS